MKRLLAYILCNIAFISIFSCSSKDEPKDIFSGTTWEAKEDMDTAIDKETYGYRLTFSSDKRYKIHRLDKNHYIISTASQGTYKYEDPYLTLIDDKGDDKVFIYYDYYWRLYAGYYGVNFYQQ